MKSKKNLSLRKGYKNRHKNPLPKKESVIEIIVNDAGQFIYTCLWKPYNPNNLKEGEIPPSEGYLGKASIIKGSYKGIGFNVWEQNNQEFIYYKILDDE